MSVTTFCHYCPEQNSQCYVIGPRLKATLTRRRAASNEPRSACGHRYLAKATHGISVRTTLLEIVVVIDHLQATRLGNPERPLKADVTIPVVHILACSGTYQGNSCGLPVLWSSAYPLLYRSCSNTALRLEVRQQWSVRFQHRIGSPPKSSFGQFGIKSTEQTKVLHCLVLGTIAIGILNPESGAKQEILQHFE
jgi:hypothetical protein